MFTHNKKILSIALLLSTLGVQLSTAQTTVSFDSFADGVTITNPLPVFLGTAADPDTGISNVQVLLAREANPGFVYWTGTNWDSTITTLAADYNSTNQTWQLNMPLPNGTNLFNADYQVQVLAYNNDAGFQFTAVSFTVEYHPVFVWTQGSFSDSISGNENLFWENPANWDVGSVPPPEATVIINSGTPDSRNLSSLPVYQLILNNGTLTVSNMLIEQASFSGGQLNGGTVTLQTNGVFNWYGGTLSGVYQVTNSATFTIIGNDSLAANSTLNNNGTIVWSNDFQFGGSGGVTLNNNGLFDIRGNGQFFNLTGGNPVVFNNYGTLRKSAGASTTTFASSNNGWLLNQYGLLDIQTGLLALQANATFQDGSTFSGAGLTHIESGTTTLTGNGTIISNATVELAGGTLNGFGSFIGDGTFKWSSGKVSGTNNVTSPLVITGSANKSLTGLLTSANTNAVWSGTGDIDIFAGAAFTNSGVLVAQSDATVGNVAGGSPQPRFVNTGTFKKSGGTNSTSFPTSNTGVAFDNSGLVIAETGILSLAGGGSDSGGTFCATTGRTEFAGGTHNFISPITFTGTGRTRIVGGTVALVNSTNLVLTNATLEIATLGTLGGTGAFSGPGTLDWTGGNISATLDLLTNFTCTISGTATKTLTAGNVFNHGTIIWTGTGALNGQTGSLLDNRALFNAQNDSPLVSTTTSSPNPVFYNAGTFLKTFATNNTTISQENSGWNFTNIGVIDIETGFLVNRAQLILNDGGAISGAGTTFANQATVTINGTTTIASGGNFLLTGSATLSGTGNFCGTGSFSWSGGTFQGNLTIGSTANLLLIGNIDRNLKGTITNNGTATWTGTSVMDCYSGSVFVNNGTFLALNDSQFANVTGGTPPQFYNNGVFRKNNSTGSTIFSDSNGGVTFNNSGTVDLLTGTVQLNGNNIASPTSQVRLYLGGLTIGTQYSCENFNFAVNYNGTLVLVLTNDFTPVVGNSFTVSHYGGTRTGQFAATQLPVLPANSIWKLTYGANSLVAQIAALTAFQTFSLTNGNFQFSLSGQSGSQCVISGTTNLLDWTPIFTNAPFNGNLNFTDPNATNFPARFYRATITL